MWVFGFAVTERGVLGPGSSLNSIGNKEMSFGVPAVVRWCHNSGSIFGNREAFFFN